MIIPILAFVLGVLAILADRLLNPEVFGRKR